MKGRIKMTAIMDMMKSGVLSEDSLVKEIKESVAKGWDVNQKDECGCRPLMLAETQKIAEVLIEYGILPNPLKFLSVILIIARSFCLSTCLISAL